jgi:hypothetical protein
MELDESVQTATAFEHLGLDERVEKSLAGGLLDPNFMFEARLTEGISGCRVFIQYVFCIKH